MAVFVEDGAYGVPEGICFSLPAASWRQWSVIKDLSIDSFSQEKLKRRSMSC